MANSKIYLKSEAGGTTTLSRDTTANSGNLVLPASGNVTSVDTAVTDNAIARFDSTTGKLQNSSVVVDDNGNVGIGITPSSDSKLQAKTGTNRNISISDQVTISGAATIEAIDDTRGSNIPLELRGTTISITRPSGTTCIFDSAGNVGIGVTPSAWSSWGKVLEVNAYAMASNTIQSYQFNNAILTNDGFKYKNIGPANLHTQENGSFTWQTAPFGTAGQPITWNNAMTLGASGNLLIGTTTDNGVDKLQVNGSIKNVLQQTTVSDSNSGVFADTVEYTKTYNSNAGAGIAGSVFGDVPMIGELYAIEHGTGKYLRATIFKASSSAGVDVTVHASSGLALVATNSGGTIQLGGYTVGSNVRMMTKLRKIY